MDETTKETGNVIAEAAGAVIALGLLAYAFFGGGLATVAEFFSKWLYG